MIGIFFCKQYTIGYICFFIQNIRKGWGTGDHWMFQLFVLPQKGKSGSPSVRHARSSSFLKTTKKNKKKQQPINTLNDTVNSTIFCTIYFAWY